MPRVNSAKHDDMQHLYSSGTGFQVSLMLFEALRLGMFDMLKENAVSLAVLAKAIKVSEKALLRFLRVLQAMGLIKKDGSFYRNTSLAERYLTENRSMNLRDVFMHLETHMTPWLHLRQSLRKGGMLTPGKTVLKQYPQQLKRYLAAMHAAGRAKSSLICRIFPVHKYRNMLDIGGGMGTYSVSFAQAQKKLRSTIIDLKTVVHYTKQYLQNCGMDTRIRVIAAECLTDPLPEDEYDLIFISNVLHIYSSDDARRLIKKAAKTLKRFGTLLIHDYIFGLGDMVSVSLFDMTMLVGTPQGRCHQKNELKHWMHGAGLINIMTAEVAAGTSLMWGDRGKGVSRLGDRD